MSHKDHQISIWFFIGLLLGTYGLIILGAGIADWGTPSRVVLSELHVGVWWGALLLVLGSAYTYAFAPNRARK